MANDPAPALREELHSALAVVRPQIKGLYDFQKIVVSGSVVAQAVGAQISVRENRARLLNIVLAKLDEVVEAMNNLEADGYPALPNVDASAEVLAGLHSEADAIAFALKIFEARLPASKLEIKLGSTAEKL